MQNASLKLLIGAGIGKSTMWWNFQPYGSTFYSGSPHLLLICVFHSNKYLKIHRSSWMSLSDLTSDFGSHYASLEVWGRLFFLCTKCPLPIFQETKILSWDEHFTTKIAVVFWRSFSISCSRYISFTLTLHKRFNKCGHWTNSFVHSYCWRIAMQFHRQP